MTDERKAFEAAALAGNMDVSTLGAPYPVGTYADSRTNAAWWAWQARANSPSRVNINQPVRVRLTDHGREILRKRDEELHRRVPTLDPYTRPVDSEGYTRFQLWDLMHIFGPYVSLGMECPFETVILLEVGHA